MMTTPSVALPRSTIPVISVPIKLAWITLPEVVATELPSIMTPASPVAGDNIALTVSRSSDLRSLYAVVDDYPVTSVADGSRAVMVGADVVSIDSVVVGPGVVDLNSVAGCASLARNHVAFADRAITTDGVVVRSAANHDSVVAVAKRRVAGGVDTNVVALDGVVCGCRSP